MNLLILKGKKNLPNGQNFPGKWWYGVVLPISICEGPVRIIIIIFLIVKLFSNILNFILFLIKLFNFKPGVEIFCN